MTFSLAPCVSAQIRDAIGLTLTLGLATTLALCSGGDRTMGARHPVKRDGLSPGGRVG